MLTAYPRSYFLRLVAAFCLVVILAFALAAWLVITIGHNQIRELADEQLLLRAHLAMRQVDRFLEQHARELESWSEIEILDEVLLGDPNFRVQNLILDLRAGSGETYRKILVLDRDGVIVASTAVETIGDPWEGNLRYIQKSEHTRLHVGHEGQMREGESPGLLMAHPITPLLSGGIAGWLVAELNWENVDSSLALPLEVADDPAADSARLLLLTKWGEIIGGEGDVADSIKGFLDADGATLIPEDVKRELEQDSPYLVATSVSATGLSVSSGGLWVLALWSKSDAYSAVGPFTAAVIGSSLIGLALGLGASYIIAGYFTRGIRNLMVATDRLAGGDLAFRVDEGSDDELGRLASSFNVMAERLKNARDARESALARWRSLAEYAPGLILTVDPKGRVLYANRGVGGVDPENLVGMDAVKLFRPENRVQVEASLHRVFRKRDALSLELQSTSEGNPSSWSHIRIGPVIRDDEAVAATLISTDITERKLLEQESLNVSERERERIGRDLHDGVGQVMTGVALFSRSLRSKLQARNLPEAADAAKIERLMNDAVRQTRALAKGLFPMEIEVAGLRSALQELARTMKTMTEVSCEVTGVPTLPGISSQGAMHLYRLAQEAMNNAVRHGKASQIRVNLFESGGNCGLEIRDNGVGIAKTPGNGMGLRLMEYRAELVHGSLEMERNPEGGTVVRCVIVCANNAAAPREEGE